MRVAQFIHRYPPALGGAESWAARLSRDLVAHGHEVEVWTTTARELESFSRSRDDEFLSGTSIDEGVQVRRFRPSLRFAGRRYLLKAASLYPHLGWRSMTQHWAPLSLKMWRAACSAKHRFDVVHAIGFPYGPILRSAHRLAKRSNAKFVVTPFLHLGDVDQPNNRIRRAYTAPHLIAVLRKADRVLVQTPTEFEAVKKLGIPASRIVLQGLGVDPSECIGGNREGARRSWEAAPEEIVFGHLATLSREKGTQDLNEAFERVRIKGMPCRLVLAGHYSRSFRLSTRYLQTLEFVIHPGTLSDSQRRDFFAGIDVFVLPSISDSFGLVFLEAWANRLPVIGYRAGGVVDVIRHDIDGSLVPCGNIEALALAMETYLYREDVRRGQGDAGHARLAIEFRWEDKLQIARETLTRW